jgi:inner membrane protein
VIDYLGWAATVVFVTSYFCKRAEVLRRVQMIGAAIWMIYGVLIQASPVVVANLLVLLAAAWTAARPSTVSRAPALNIEE